ncbi:MAG TPA: HAMP domain-containing sensor histidine kinase [Terriglobales bacterium]|nr:HAMP domain-containing sensor histidine kinase [Terriglobales bacterium]
MIRLRLRTQLLGATLLVTSVLIGAILLILRYTVRSEISQQLTEGISASVRAFEATQKQRDLQLSRNTAMLAELPTLKALMTTEHALTIQDGSTSFWKLAGSDLFALAGSDSHIKAVHLTKGAWTIADVERHFQASLSHGDELSWWYDDGHLYRVCLRPIVAGQGDQELGMLALGYEVSNAVAAEIGNLSRSEIALATGGTVIASTLPDQQERAFKSQLRRDPNGDAGASWKLPLDSGVYQVASVPLEANLPLPVRCYVLMPLRASEAFLQHLNRILLALGLGAVLLSGLMLLYISQNVTRPLENLVKAVRALAGGDYAYSVSSKGSLEVDQLSEAFAIMRQQLLQSQQHRIQAERMAALSRTASSISHDLRHYLAALLANAEFLYEAESLHLDKEDVYREIKIASDQMTELIDSFRELANDRAAIMPVPANLEETIRRAIEAVKSRHPFRDRTIQIVAHGAMSGEFDARKLERVFFNLVLNACEATTTFGKVAVEIGSDEKQFQVRVSDNGPGIPVAIRETLFEPFVSAEKANGTGLGLAIVSKIIHDHDGEVRVEKTSDSGTVILITLPRVRPRSSVEGVAPALA